MTASVDGASYRVGVDIGGTFTDVVVASGDGRVSVQKLLSTPGDYSIAVVDGVRAGLAELAVAPSAHSEIVHATTVATNTILEGTGAACALITTRGFRDVLEIGRLRIPALYDFKYQKRPLLIPRRQIFEVAERINARGEVVIALEAADLERVVEAVASAGCESVAISLLNSYANAVHERMVAAAVRKRLPGLDISVSSEILPRVGEYERTSTTVINAYVMPRVRRYVRSLVDRLHDLGIKGSVLLMRSGGGIMGVERAIREPVHIVESGPVAGVLACRQILGAAGFANILTFDVGGTTAKASIIEDGRLLKTVDYEVGGTISSTTRLTGGGGYPIQVPVIDIAEVGAGGGSIVWVDSGGSLRVGPLSAGAVPGPACYGLGGDRVTLTDADLLLGYLNPERLAGGLRLFPDKAEKAMREQVAEPLGLDLPAAAHGVFQIANAQMMGAIRAVSTQRGRDVRSYALAAFGGCGPMHAAELARALGIATVVIPPAPGVFSATGLLSTDLEYEASRVLYRAVSDLGVDALNGVLEELRARVEALFTDEGIAHQALALEMSFDMRYWGQNADLTVAFPLAPLSAESLDLLADAFDAEHERTYGHRAQDERIIIVVARVTGRASPELAREVPTTLEGMVSRHAGFQAARSRRAYFGPDIGFATAPVIARHQVPEKPLAGPLLVEEYDSITVVPPGCGVRLDKRRNIMIEVGGDGRGGSDPPPSAAGRAGIGTRP